MQRTLSVWGTCQAFEPAETDAIGAAAGSLLIADLDLSNRKTIVAAHLALAPHRRSGRPCLFLLRDMSPRAQVQANALGAQLIMPFDTPQPLLLEKVGALLGRLTIGEPGATLQRRFIAASAATAELLEAASAGAPLPRSAINRSVEAINRAADGGDLAAWLDMVWQHDDATYQHCLLVSGLAAAFARHLGFRAADREQLTGAAVLHDVGKALIPLDILRKEGPLAAEEQAVMRRHPEIGHGMLARQGGFSALTLEAVLSHHEYLDGSGYPAGLGADHLPDVVRMITICDIYAALIERRPYKPALPPEQAFGMLADMGGKLDADLLRAFRELVLGTESARPNSGRRSGKAA